MADTEPTTSGRIYDKLVGNDPGQRVTTGISDEAAEHVPPNFLRFLLATCATKTGDVLSKPGVILTWLMGSLGAPPGLIGLVVPVRESGSLLLQIVVGEWSGRVPIRKTLWCAGSILQGLSILGMVPVALFTEGTAAGWWIVGLMAVFSLSRGICSVVSKDLLGRTIPKTRRGRLGGFAASISGWVAAGIALWLIAARDRELPPSAFAVILAAAGLLWLLAAGVMATLEEIPAETPGRKKNPLREIAGSLALLRDDRDFRMFCLARGLMAGTVLSMPFYVLLAREATGGKSIVLGILMLSGSVATALSGAVWGKFADRSSRLTMAGSGIAAGAVGIVTGLCAGANPGSTAAMILYGILFFLIGLAHTGIRQGRKTYLVDFATADNRASLVAVSNTVIGLVVLAGGSLSLLAGLIGEQGVIFVFAGLGLIGGLLVFRLPEVQDENDGD